MTRVQTDTHNHATTRSVGQGPFDGKSYMIDANTIHGYICNRWQQYNNRCGSRYVRRIIREEFRVQRASDFARSKREIEFDTLVRVTQIFEIKHPDHLTFRLLAGGSSFDSGVLRGEAD